ncbi:SRR1-domain-containing protein [Fomitopsis serialis]|uniref:SRR1-domain-containing protein n=1 Tax=Fomitopsis serialis TaxID=139415 RepID=UPI002008709C|nr:SRR1-domain-containing protein [Neoantrodia serialis]KAH9934876.1 SRR1-domain-containing protein [Neoantrodia serialis]
MASQDVPSFAYSEAFTPARPRKKRNNRPARDGPSPSALLQQTTDELAATEWTRECRQILRESLDALGFRCPSVLCLGLGSPSASRDARAQLAFLLAICDDIRIDRANVSVYDPVFAAEDVALLAALGRGRFRAAAPTVAFMPHCDLQLYENLLRENWSGAGPHAAADADAGAGLSNLVLISNRLSDYAESVPARKMSVEHPCVWRLAPYLVSRNLPACAAYPTAFNNTAVQYARVGDAGEDFWELPPPTDTSRGGSDEHGCGVAGGGSV